MVRVRLLVVVIEDRDVRRRRGDELLAGAPAQRIQEVRVVDDDLLRLVPPALAEVRERPDVLEELPVATLHRGPPGVVAGEVVHEPDPRSPVVLVASRVGTVVERDRQRELDVADVLVEGAHLEVVAQSQVHGEPVARQIVLGVDREVVHRNPVIHRLALDVLDRVGLRIVRIEWLVRVEDEPAVVTARAVRLEINPVVVHAELDLVIAARTLREPGEVVLELPAGLGTHLVVTGAGTQVRAIDLLVTESEALRAEVTGGIGAVAERRTHLVLRKRPLEAELVQ